MKEKKLGHAEHGWVPQAVLAPGPKGSLLECFFLCLILSQAHELTADPPPKQCWLSTAWLSSCSLHWVQQCENVKSGCWGSSPHSATRAQSACTFLGLRRYSWSRVCLCRQLRCTKPDACKPPDSFALALAVIHGNEIIFCSPNEGTTVIKLLKNYFKKKEFEIALLLSPFFSSKILKIVKS